MNVQLINADNDQHIWAEDYDRDLTDVFAIQTDFAQKIARELRAKLSPMEKAQIERKPTENSEAYLAFLEAHDLFTRMDKFRTNTEKAEQLFEKATKLDPNFAAAFAGLAWVEDWMYHDFDPTPARKEKAHAAAEKRFVCNRICLRPISRWGFIIITASAITSALGRICHRKNKFAKLGGGLYGNWCDRASPG